MNIPSSCYGRISAVASSRVFLFFFSNFPQIVFTFRHIIYTEVSVLKLFREPETFGQCSLQSWPLLCKLLLWPRLLSRAGWWLLLQHALKSPSVQPASQYFRGSQLFFFPPSFLRSPAFSRISRICLRLPRAPWQWFPQTWSFDGF